MPAWNSGGDCTHARKASKTLYFVVASFLDKALNATATLGSLMYLRSGGGVRYDSTLPLDDAEPKAPNPPPPTAARLLEACDLNCLLLILAERCVVRELSRS